jgi:hypothetical protein
MRVKKFKLALKVSDVHGQIPRIAADFVVAAGYAVIAQDNDLVPMKPRKEFCESQEISYPVKRFRQNHPSAPQIVRLQKGCGRNSFVRIYTTYGRKFKLRRVNLIDSERKVERTAMVAPGKQPGRFPDGMLGAPRGEE